MSQKASSSTENPLARGGTHKGHSAAHQTYLTHTLPYIHKNSIIVAATHCTLQNAQQNGRHADGWFISDFYAFNYLLKGAVPDQTWLTAVEPAKLVAKYGDYLHGYPKRERKVVLSTELLKSEITAPTLVSSGNMVERFLEEVKKAAVRAQEKQCPLVIMVFSHGIENHHLLLNSPKDKKGVSILRLKQALEQPYTTEQGRQSMDHPNQGRSIEVTLFTTACYSGGWAITPDLNITAMAAAPADDKSISWPLSDSIGRASGSVFAGATIAALVDVSTPLLQDASRPTPPAAEGSSSMQPDEPNAVQTETYNEFCRTITDTLGRQGISRIFGNDFHFSSQDDNWGASWNRSSRIPLAYFRERWNKLEARAPSVLPAGGKVATANDPTAPTHYTASPDEYIDKMTEDMVHSRVRSMAGLFYSLCPGDWNKGQDTALGSGLWLFINDMEAEDDKFDPYEIAAIIHFRWDACLMADRFVHDHGLNRPNGEICVMWHEDEYKQAMYEKIGRKDWEQRTWEVWKSLLDKNAKIEPAEHQGPDFRRPHAYIMSAICESASNQDEANQMVEAYVKYVADIRQFFLIQTLASVAVRREGRQWLKAIGRRIGRSLSPSKSTRDSLSQSLARMSVGSEGAGEASGSRKLGKAPMLHPDEQQGEEDIERNLAF